MLLFVFLVRKTSLTTYLHKINAVFSTQGFYQLDIHGFITVVGKNAKMSLTSGGVNKLCYLSNIKSMHLYVNTIFFFFIKP